MATGVQELKLAARMQEWSARIAECRSSGMSVRAWCNEQGISVQTYYRWEKRFVEKATQQLALPAPTQAGLLMRVNPETLPSGEMSTIGSCITIRHGDSLCTAPGRQDDDAFAMANGNARSGIIRVTTGQHFRIDSHQETGLRRCRDRELLSRLCYKLLFPVVVSLTGDSLLSTPCLDCHPAGAVFRDLR